VCDAASELPVLGLGQWFHYEDYRAVERTVDLMGELGCGHLRTGISWADFHRPGGRAWYDWQNERLAESGLEVLMSIWHTPPSLAEGGVCAGPPKRLGDYADFVEQCLELYGPSIHHLELWNEPNNKYKWAFERFDPRWEKFARMTDQAARVASGAGVPTVLGGMMPVDPDWLELMAGHTGLTGVDVVGIHGFPGMWWPDQPNWDWYSHWKGWADRVRMIERSAGGRPVWITEAGYATVDPRDATVQGLDTQVHWLREAAAAPAERVYWYCLIDLDPGREAIEGFHVDENEYHLGLVGYNGQRKPAFDVFAELVKRSGSAAVGPVGADEGG
jgi:CDP-paratose 2-epimerase